MSGRPRRPIVLLLPVALALAACQAAPSAPASPGQSTGGVTGSSAVPLGSAGASSGSPATGYVAGDGDLFLDPMEALDGLTSHSAKLTWTFDGTDGGQASSWTETTTFRRSGDPAAVELLVERSNIPDRPKREWLALSGGSLYRAVDDEACAVALPEPGRNPFVEPASRLSALIGGRQTGTETVGGVEAEAFEFDGKAMDLVEPTTANGRAWIAASNNLLLRYEVDIQGGPDYFGDGISGRLTGRYELTDANAAIAITIPAACPPGLIAGGQPTDAADVVAVPGRTQLTTAMSVKAAAAFYHDTSLAFGWKPVGDPKIQEDPDVAALTFTQGALTISVSIVAQGGRSLVTISASRS